MEHNPNTRQSFGQTDLMIACKTGNVADVREILEWRDDDGERADISARDENGQTALSLAKQSNNAEIVAMIEQHLFLTAVENGDIEAVKTYLSSKESNREVLYRREETDNFRPTEQTKIQSREDDLIEDPPPKRFKGGFEAQFTSKDSITRSIWLEAVTIAQHKRHGEMLTLLFNDQRFIHGFNEDGQTILHQVVAEYLVATYDSGKLETIEILIKSVKFNANVLNSQNETILEFVCKIDSRPINSEINKVQMDELLRIFHRNGIALNGRNKNGETFVMLACKNGRVDIVRSLIKLASSGSGFDLDIDAVDNSGETALIKAKEKDFYKIVATLLKFKLIAAVKDKKVDIVKSMLPEFRNTTDIFVKSWNSNQNPDDMSEVRKKISSIWLDAIYIAMENDTKNSDEILKLLLDCDILLSQDIETGHFSFKELIHGDDYDDDANVDVDDDKRLHSIELLLKSGKINVNDRDAYGSTVLHWTEEEKETALFIRYGADVNKKDNEGKTPLMPISDKPESEPGNEKFRFPVLRTLLEKGGTMMNLDAMDCDGRTALINAVMWHRSHDVELLLKKGTSVNLSDHLGFTALHHALHGDIDEYFEFPRNSEEFKIIKELAIPFDAERLKKHRDLRNEEWSEERVKIVEMLLQRPDIDVNALSCEMFSPLDIAEGQLLQIPPSIINALVEKGARLNVFRHTEPQSTSEFRYRYVIRILQRIANKEGLSKTDLETLKDIIIETFKEQIVSGKDQRGRTALHLFVISSYDLPKFDKGISALANTIVDELISFGCSVNETDFFGRTPLHYANEMFWKLLISKSADASIKDNDGNRAIEDTLRTHSGRTAYIIRKVTDRIGETYLLRLMNNKQIELNVQYVDDSKGDIVPEFSLEKFNPETAPELLWKEDEYACRHPLANQITKDVRDLMNSIAKEIERLNPRFEIRPELVGSSNEGTRLHKPDEFDFNFVLTKISELCEVSQSPELPTGFVRLKRKSAKVGETSEFDRFFGKDEILNTEKLNWQFATAFHNALINIDNQQNFEWNLKLTSDYTPISAKIKKVLKIKMNTPLNFFNVDIISKEHISVDIVPCIHVDGYWPDDAISNVSDEIKKFGCNLIFEGPQKLYPWVPYSESCVRISFSKAESDMIKQSCDNAREAYMMGKMMVENRTYDVSQYILKNSLLYCIEALTPTSEKASQLGLSFEELDSKFHQMDRYLWLKCLMKCHLEFVAQDFCPSYFQPTFSNCSVIEIEHNYLKKVSFDWFADRSPTFPKLCKYVCELYRGTSNDTSESSFQLPAPEPLWERFDGKQLIANLCEIAYK